MPLIHHFEEMTPEKRPQDALRNGTGLTFEPVEHGGMCPDTMPQAVILKDAEGRSATYVPEEEPLENRPQDPLQRGEGLTFETLAHGGEYPDDMPQELRVSDPAGNSCIYVPIKENGRVVDSKGFSLIADTPLSSQGRLGGLAME